MGFNIMSQGRWRCLRHLRRPDRLDAIFGPAPFQSCPQPFRSAKPRLEDNAVSLGYKASVAFAAGRGDAGLMARDPPVGPARTLPRQRLRPAVENVEVFAVGEDAAALLACGLAHDAEIDQVLERFGDGWKRELELPGRRLDRDERPALHHIMDAKRGGRTASERLDRAPVCFEQRHEFARGIDRLRCRVANTGQKIVHPSFPRAVFADLLQQPVVLGAPHLEVQAEIQSRLTQRAGIAQHERDQQTPDAAVAIEERVDGFELHVGKPRLDQRRQLRIVRMQELFERVEAFIQPIRRRRNAWVSTRMQDLPFIHDCDGA